MPSRELSFPVFDALQHLARPARAFAARGALAAGFVRVEMGEVEQAFDHAGGFVHHDDSARARHRTNRSQRIKIDDNVVDSDFLLSHRSVGPLALDLVAVICAQDLRGKTCWNKTATQCRALH